jgi:O-antigen ligase
MNLELLNQIAMSVYPIAAVSSQSVLDLSTILMLLVTAWMLYQKRSDFNFKWIGIEWAFLGYVATVILGFAVNASPDAEWLRTLVKFSWLVNLYVLILTFQRLRIEVAQVIKVLAVGTLLPNLYAMASYMNGYDLLTHRINERITGLVNSATYHAHGNAVLFVILLGALVFSPACLSKRWKIYSWFSLTLLGLSIFLTFTRGVWLSIFFSSLIMALCFFGWKRVLQIFGVVLLLAGLGWQLWPKFNQRLQDTNATYNHERLNLTKVNIEMWREYPWLGIGYGENLRRNREYWDRPHWNMSPGYIESHAHNQYLNVLSTTGIVGSIFFNLFFFFFIFKNVKMLRRTSRQLAPQKFSLLAISLWAQIEFALACLTDVGFEYAKIRALLILVWALVIAIDQKPELVKESSHV